MIRTLVCVLALFVSSALAQAGELDREAGAPKPTPVPTAQPAPAGTELDAESPQQEYFYRRYWGPRWGWGGWGWGYRPYVGFYNPVFYGGYYPLARVYGIGGYYSVYTGYSTWYGFNPYCYSPFVGYGWYW